MSCLDALTEARELLNVPDFVQGLEELFRDHFIGLHYGEDFLANVAGQVISEDTDNIVSDVRMKFCKRMANKKEPFTSSEVAWISSFAGSPDEGDSPFDWDDNITEEQLIGYAQHLKNFLYTYKDEATDIDPSIDPNEEHIGPMAQDIEKVAPDCVKETPEGVKTVDGNRLSLVNAGVIGELARRVLELEEKVNAR